ncbi:MAG: polysaccharide biosynthesis protein [Bryobacteraceae bacterium]
MSFAPVAGYRRFLSPCEAGSLPSQFASGAAGRSVLITGAGGSIGSGLCDAIAAAGPAQLALLDSSEHSLFKVHQHLDLAHAAVPHAAILGSITDAGLLDRLFSRFHPTIVYHAAALKHVPLLELNPFAAVRNNALGSYTLAQAALRHGVSTLVLVSSDKAVNPHSIMGASKRLAELTVAALSAPSCRMNAVRLGNVIGSSGSVVPIFQEQIRQRAPLTVTHPEARRYFICLQEAVEAILAAGAAHCSGKILLPELGEPVRIADLASFLIREAADDLPIRFIGLRPGEKLDEDLVFQTEVQDGLAAGPLSVILTPAPAPADLHSLMQQLAGRLACGDLAGLIGAIRSAVPEYEPSSLVLAATRAAGKAV